MSIPVNELFVVERTSSDKETGYATVVLDIIERKEGKDYIVGTYTSTISGVGVDVATKHDECD
jgi:hypothetical protein